MSDMVSAHVLWVLLIGAAAVLAVAVHASFHRVHLPSLVGYLIIGFLFSLMDVQWNLLGSRGREAFAFLADLGIVVILFRVGLHSDLAALTAKLKSAALIWIGDVGVSGVVGFLVARYALGLEFAPALIIGAALTATSIGVSTAAWEDNRALNSDNGRLMLDVAELDDISGIAFMALLLALLPILDSETLDLEPLVLAAVFGEFALRFAAFAAICFIFARYIEGPMTRTIKRLEHAPRPMLTIAGTGFIIAAIAGWLGFSLAIGALFAGLAFSRDPVAVKTEGNFDDLYAFFSPFFFIGIGLATDLTQLGAAAEPIAWLVAGAILGKLLGAGLPAALLTDTSGALLIGASMIPRAEITMIIAGKGYGSGILSEVTYTALLLAAAGTSVVGAWLVHRLLGRARHD